MGELFRVEQLINGLNANFNSGTLPTQIQLISTLNDAIVTTEQHEIYLKDMNSTLLKVMEGDRDNLTVMEKNKIHDLAHSCPAQNGLAVFKATINTNVIWFIDQIIQWFMPIEKMFSPINLFRPIRLLGYFIFPIGINTLYEPLMTYNDYALCAPANKGGKGLYDDLFSFLNGDDVKNYNSNFGTLGDYTEIKIYPNPTNISFTLQCNRVLNGSLYIFDLTGRLVKQIVLNGNKEIIEIENLSEGMYTYKITDNKETFYGKIQKK